MNQGCQKVIEEIHATPLKAVIFVTGGAAHSLSWLLSVPGASNTVLECKVPYAQESVQELLGDVPLENGYCSVTTAEKLAEAAYRRAAQLCSFGTPFVGVAATCALVSASPKRGDHRVHVAVAGSGGSVQRASLTLSKGARSRIEEDVEASKLVIEALARACGVENGVDCVGFTKLEGDHLEEHSSAPVVDPLEKLLAGQVECVEFSGDGQVVVNAPRSKRIYLPGSFNPLHEGHCDLLHTAVAQDPLHREGCFELSVTNADKGVLPLQEVKRRVSQFTARKLPLLVTANCSLFTQKAQLLPGSAFVVGYDTAVRLIKPQYYADKYAEGS